MSRSHSRPIALQLHALPAGLHRSDGRLHPKGRGRGRVIPQQAKRRARRAEARVLNLSHQAKPGTSAPMTQQEAGCFRPKIIGGGGWSLTRGASTVEELECSPSHLRHKPFGRFSRSPSSPTTAHRLTLDSRPLFMGWLMHEPGAEACGGASSAQV